MLLIFTFNLPILYQSDLIDLSKIPGLKNLPDLKPLIALHKSSIIGLTATVTQLSDSDNTLNNAIKIGDKIYGYYVYNSGAKDSNPGDTTVGDYWYYSKPYGIFLKTGNIVFKTDPNNVQFLIELVNRDGGDNYLIRSYSNLPLSNGIPINHIAWQLDDPSGKALSSDSLQQAPKPPVLNKWDDPVGLTISGGPSFNEFFIRAHVNSVFLLK